jgi:hypothetical protein
VHGDVLGLVTFDFVLWIVLARVVCVSFVVEISCMNFDEHGRSPFVPRDRQGWFSALKIGDRVEGGIDGLDVLELEAPNGPPSEGA